MQRLILAMMTAVIMAGVGAAEAASGLRNHKQINDGLLVIAIADRIRKKCPSIDARMLRAYSYMRSLKRLANDAGYDDKEIEAFVEDKAEKRRVEGAARAWLGAHGVVTSNPESYCVAGRVEIDRKSQIGALLRSR